VKLGVDKEKTGQRGVLECEFPGTPGIRRPRPLGLDFLMKVAVENIAQLAREIQKTRCRHN
jgi:hypothetical protein